LTEGVLHAAALIVDVTVTILLLALAFCAGCCTVERATGGVTLFALWPPHETSAKIAAAVKTFCTTRRSTEMRIRPRLT
jgi:hypothetical protein